MFRLQETTLTVQKFEHYNRGKMLAGTVDWRGLNFCTAKALLHGCVVTQLRDAILDC